MTEHNCRRQDVDDWPLFIGDVTYKDFEWEDDPLREGRKHKVWYQWVELTRIRARDMGDMLRMLYLMARFGDVEVINIDMVPEWDYVMKGWEA